jgi:hypothetical protein
VIDTAEQEVYRGTAQAKAGCVALAAVAYNDTTYLLYAFYRLKNSLVTRDHTHGSSLALNRFYKGIRKGGSKHLVMRSNVLAVITIYLTEFKTTISPLVIKCMVNAESTKMLSTVVLESC